MRRDRYSKTLDVCVIDCGQRYSASRSHSKACDKMIDAEDKIRNNIARLTLNDSFWGYLFSHMQRVKNVDLPAVMGVCIDKHGSINLVYNPKMLMELPNDELEIVLSHEGWHILNNHIIRFNEVLENFNDIGQVVASEQDTKDAFINRIVDSAFKEYIMRTWNIAADCSVNYLCGAPDALSITTPDGNPYKICHAKFYGMEVNKSAEFYFSELLKFEPNSKNAHGDSSVGEESGCKNLLGDHSGWDLSKIEDRSLVRSKVEAQVKDLVYKAYKSCRNRGNLPGALKEMIDSMLKPTRIPYYLLIKRLLCGSRKDKLQKAYSKFNRKRSYAFLGKNKLSFLPFPGNKKDESFKIVVGIDVSGSISTEDVYTGLSAAAHIIEHDRYCETIVLQCDTQVTSEYKIKKVSDIQFEVIGRGGTILAPMLKRAAELKCDVALIFTDAACDDITQISRSELPKKIIWVIPHNAPDDAIAGTGFVIRVDNK